VAGIYDPIPTREVAERLRGAAQDRLDEFDDDAVYAYLADAVYQERSRLERSRGRWMDEDKIAHQAIERAAVATRRARRDQERAILELVDGYAHEIHNRFSHRTHRFATKVLPGALTRLLTAAQPMDLLGGSFDPASRMSVQGDVPLLKELAKTHTLVLAPTHVSNLDSPMIGYAGFAAGLPPFIYGAGLNLFTNPAMSFFMSRLGAYTVDRRKKHGLYKHTLKDYSVDSIGRRCHSLFFPGGTRSRSGRIEGRLKKGLLGTAIQAWQQGLAAGRPHPEVLVVPCTLSFSLVLEAETLIEDSLSEEGKSRYIISDDEFSEPRVVASFASRVLNLDASMFVRFGRPMDLVGNPVDDDGHSLDQAGQHIDRRGYVADSSGRVVFDEQRDRVYTEHLADALVGAYRRDQVVVSTHLVSYAAWKILEARHPRLDTFQRVLLSPDQRQIEDREMLSALGHLLEQLDARAARGEIQLALPTPAQSQTRAHAVLDEALDRFSHFHARPGLERRGRWLTTEPKLVLYYGNRLAHSGLQIGTHS